MEDNSINSEEQDWKQDDTKTDQSDSFENLNFNDYQTSKYHLSCHGNSGAALASLESLNANLTDQAPMFSCNCMCHSHDNKHMLCDSCDCRSIQYGLEYIEPHPSSLTDHLTTQRLSCRQEVLYHNDVTVDELAGYLDELLHLPRPMSDMAELMYA